MSDIESEDLYIGHYGRWSTKEPLTFVEDVPLANFFFEPNVSRDAKIHIAVDKKEYASATLQEIVDFIRKDRNSH